MLGVVNVLPFVFPVAHAPCFLSTFADSLLEEMGLGGGAQFIGMHVRAGDSCIKWQQDFGGDCVGLHHHLSHARLLSERYGIKDIFVATDDPAVLERLRDKEKTSGGDIRFVGVERYRSLLQEMEKTKDVWTENRLRRGEVPAGPLLRSTVADILVLSRASAFVLHFASNLSRLAYQLALTRTRRHLPFGDTTPPAPPARCSELPCEFLKGPTPKHSE